jgi:hypothetical protein
MDTPDQFILQTLGAPPLRVNFRKRGEFCETIQMANYCCFGSRLFCYFPSDSGRRPGKGFSTIGSDTVRAEVAQIIEEGEIDLGGHVQKYQVVQVNILEGPYSGIIMEVDYGKRQIRSDDYMLGIVTRSWWPSVKHPTMWSMHIL